MREEPFMCINEDCGARGSIRVVNVDASFGEPKVCPFCDQQL